MIKFRTNKYKLGIEEVKVDDRETDHSVWIDGSRSAKWSDWHQYHDTYEQAFNYLDCRYTQRLARAENNLSTAKNEYASVQELKNK